MRIILSPAKKMNMDTDGLEPSALPVFLDRTEQILSYLRSKTPQELQTLWCYFDYVQEHLRILSAFYGVLKPMDGVTPYRLEMQSKAKIKGCADLYDFWKDSLYKEVRDESGIIINLASKEYSKCIEKYLEKDDIYITVNFCEKSGERLVTKGTYAKMARGEMVRFMAENSIYDPEEIKKFDRLNYVFRQDLSNDREYVFEKRHLS